MPWGVVPVSGGALVAPILAYEQPGALAEAAREWGAESA